MKINFNYSLTFAIIILSSCETKIEELDIINCKDILYEGGLATFNNELYSGSCNVYYEDVLISLLSFKKGVPQGIHKGYYPNGSLEFVGYRKKGEISGPFMRYHPNGEIQTKGKLNKGVYVGEWEFYNNNGEIIEKRFYDKFGVLKDSLIINP